jgi:hypothetical protein
MVASFRIMTMTTMKMCRPTLNTFNLELQVAYRRDTAGKL